MKPLEEMGRFATVVIDPPWDIATPGFKNNGYARDLPYGTMSVDEIAELPILSVLADDALLFCWTVNSFLRDAMDLVEAWGCKHAYTMTWVKGGGPQFPGGPCYNSEWIIVGKRGSPKFLDTRAFRLANQWPRGSHSEKPEQFYGLLRRISPEPRLDVFNRRKIPGFHSWGDQAPEGPPIKPLPYQDGFGLEL